MTSPLGLAALAFVVGAFASPLAAQDVQDDTQSDQQDVTGIDPVEEDAVGALAPDLVGEAEEIAFEADQITYEAEGDRVTARGNVILRSDEASVRANEVVWDRTTGAIVASGNIRFVDDAGNQIFTETLELTDEFEAGAMDDLLLALRQGGRLAARSAERGADGTVLLTDAAYTACAVTNAERNVAQ